MNLQGFTAGYVSLVNPMQNVIVQISQGYTTSGPGRRTPTYAAPVALSAQVQELTQGDLQHLDGLNIQGAQRAIYFTGADAGAVRFSKKGGDLVTLPDGSVWLTTSVLEEWPEWVKISVTLQDGS